MQKNDRIYVAGHRGLVGSALVRRLRSGGYDNLILRTREDLDLLNQRAVELFLRSQRPEVVILAAAKVGGIGANMREPADFLYENLQIETNVIHAAHLAGVRELLFLGSSCIYPKFAQQPIQESALLTGPLEPTNAPYAIAKIAGAMLCDAYRSQYDKRFRVVMPCNLYGPGDCFDEKRSHVLPALLHRFHRAVTTHASEVTLWGSGKPRREFLYVDDLADACVYLLEQVDDCTLINIGSGTDVSIHELATIISDVVGFTGNIAYDTTQPDGTPRKMLDVSRLRSLGWSSKVQLREGIVRTYDWYLEHIAQRTNTSIL